MFEFLEKYLMGPLNKLSSFRLVRAIQAAGMASISFLTVGSLFLVLGVLPEVFPALTGFYANTFDKFTELYMMAQMASLGVVALYFLLVIGHEYTRIIAQEEKINLSPITGMLLCLFSFMFLVPQLVAGPDGIVRVVDPESNIVNGWQIGGAPARFGATGIFTAIIVCFIAINIYKFFIKRDIRVKMPDSVPDGVANSFNALIPLFVVIIILMIINGILISMGTDIFGLIAIPFGFVANLSASYPGMLAIIFLNQALWLVGIHGGAIIGSILNPIYLLHMEMNAEQGSAIPVAGEFMSAFAQNGGAGATLGLVILMAVMAKSEHFKLLGKASIVPGLFQINEPMIFGLPLVYNPHFAIPFLFAPLVSSTIGYFAIKSGLMRPVIAMQPWPTPPFLNGFIATGGDWKAGLISVLCVVVSALIYYPFFKKRDNELYQEQLATQSETEVLVEDKKVNTEKVVIESDAIK